MLTLYPSHTETYPAYENLFLLRKDWFANAETILTVRASSLTLCYSLATLVAGAGCPSTSTKIFVDICSIWKNRSLTIPTRDVHAISHYADGIDPPVLTF